MGTNPRAGRVAFLSNLALFNLHSVSIVFLYSPSPCSFKKCSCSFTGVRLEFLNLALKMMHIGCWLPSRSVIHVNPCCAYWSNHFLFLYLHSAYEWIEILWKKSHDILPRESHATEYTKFQQHWLAKQCMWSSAAPVCFADLAVMYSLFALYQILFMTQFSCDDGILELAFSASDTSIMMSLAKHIQHIPAFKVSEIIYCSLK